MDSLFFTDKSILILGGTGSIGRGILNHILKDNPKVVRILSRDEYKQFEMQNEWRDIHNLRFLIGDVRDYKRILRAMNGIDYVFHVAAMKHVPSCEYNPFEAVQTNIIGTNNVIRAALEMNIKRVVFTSTDKAISPTNTYGATKLTAERLVAAAHFHKGSNDTIFSVVRFGNVMGSRGSVIPLFKKQIIEQRKITVTNMGMTRFMMTLTQATKLTIKAMQESKGGDIFVLKMPVIRLSDLAKLTIEETAKKNELDSNSIKIEEIGLRVGEKMYEELMLEEESKGAIELKDMFVIPSPFNKNNDKYIDGKRAVVGTYSSHKEKPISKEALRLLMIEEKLI